MLLGEEQREEEDTRVGAWQKEGSKELHGDRYGIFLY